MFKPRRIHAKAPHFWNKGEARNIPISRSESAIVNIHCITLISRFDDLSDLLLIVYNVDP